MAPVSKSDSGMVGEQKLHERFVSVPSVDFADEVFDVVNTKNEVVSTATRKKCHEEGLLHRSTHVFLFRMRQVIGRNRPRVEVLLQKRAEKKAVGGGLWDVSVAVHLSTGEDYASATIRGLKEDLGIAADSADVVQIRQAYLSRQFYEEASLLDHMFTSTFAMLYDDKIHGAVVVDGEEVETVEWWSVADLVVKAKREPDSFTRWLLIELRNLDIAEVGNMMTGAI